MVIAEVKNVKKIYTTQANEVHALDGLSLSIEEGEFVAIVGASGSGKSTLLNVLGALDKPTSGEIVIRGVNIAGLSPDEQTIFRRRNIGFVYQDYNLFPEYTAYENIIFPVHLDKRREDREEVIEIMEKLGIEHCRDKFPFEMSGGEKQRVSLARALVNKPAVILADEPTGNLDAETSSEVAALLRNASDMFGQTIVMVTHDRQMADFADRVLVIKDGIVQ